MLYLPNYYFDSSQQYPDEEEQRLKAFTDTYELESRIGGKTGLWILGDRNAPFCRFCLKGRPATRFRGHAHIIPELMGANASRSFYECVECNTNIFSRYESALAQYIGNPWRALSRTKGKSGYIIHKDTSGVTIDATGNEIRVNLPKGIEVADVMDFATNTLTLEVSKNPYVPLHAYKALIKIGFLLLPEVQLREYEVTREWLADKDDSQELAGLEVRVLSMETRNHFVPEAMVWCLKSSDKVLRFQRVIVIRFGCFQFQLPLVYGRVDIDNIKLNEPFLMPDFPLLLSGISPADYPEYGRYNADLTSPITRKEEKQPITLRSDSPFVYSKTSDEDTTNDPPPPPQKSTRKNT